MIGLLRETENLQPVKEDPPSNKRQTRPIAALRPPASVGGLFMESEDASFFESASGHQPIATSDPVPRYETDSS